MGCSESKVEEIKNINYRIPEFISSASKSVVTLNFQNKTYSGFLIKLFKDAEDFFCLLTIGESISKDMIEGKEEIIFYYDNESKIKKISLNKEERLIKSFNDIGINSTVIEIIPADEISKDYFLLPVIHFHKGKLNFSNGKIKEINKYEFTLAINDEINSLGISIFLKGSSKVIGIKQNSNKANFIGPIFNYFLNYQKNNTNKHQDNQNGTNKKENYNDETNYKDSKKENGIIKNENSDYYKGEEKNGKRQGKGIEYYKNGGIKYDGDWNNDLPEGNGKLIEKDGDYYIGEFKNGLKHGKGKEYKKSGDLIYEGDFINGKREGTGKLIHEDKTYYEGEFKDGFKHGEGKTFTQYGATQYVGNFSNDLPNGYGEYYFDDLSGYHYEGQFKDGKFHGKGKKYDQDQNIIYEGDFVDGKMEGNGKLFYDNGYYYVGGFKDGKRHGDGEEYDPNGRFYRGITYLNGEYIRSCQVVSGPDEEEGEEPEYDEGEEGGEAGEMAA